MKITTSQWSDLEQQLRTYVARRVEADYVGDLVGDILLRLIRHQAEFKAANNPSAWLYRVASNVITDHYRRRSTEQRIFETNLAQQAEPVINDKAGLSPEQELSRCLMPLINDLPTLYREALYLVDIEGRSQLEAAGNLGLSLSGMKSRVQRGRLKLKHLLLDCCTIEINKQGGVVD